MSGYRTQSNDTSEDAERLQFEIWRAMSPREKAEIISRLCISVRELALAGLQVRHPSANEEELQMRLFAMTLDRETMLAAYGWDPASHGA